MGKSWGSITSTIGGGQEMLGLIVAMLTRLTNRFGRDNAQPSSGRILQALFLSVCFENQRCQVPIVLDSLNENRHSGADQN